MGKNERIYRCTEAGRKACESQDPSVSALHRRILGWLGTDTHENAVRTRLQGYADAQISEWLGLLEERGLLESQPGAAEHDLDFTDNFSVAELLGGQKREGRSEQVAAGKSEQVDANDRDDSEFDWKEVR